ncbi:MAG: hypothetical protein AAGA66_05270 [Bacteroidota bacterium]
MDKIRLELTVEEANAILNALGQQPFVKVASLIQKIQGQASSQLDNQKGEAPATDQTGALANATLAENGK